MSGGKSDAHLALAVIQSWDSYSTLYKERLYKSIEWWLNRPLLTSVGRTMRYYNSTVFPYAYQAFITTRCWIINFMFNVIVKLVQCN